MSRGLFIAVEGLGGLGKTTLSDHLADSFKESGFEVLRTREPGGTPGGEILRELLRSGKLDDSDVENQKFSAMGNALVFNAARHDHVEKVILPAIAKGQVVICDRFCDSTIAIQSIQGDIEYQRLVELHKLAIGVCPDLTILLDGTAELANSRLSSEEIKSDKFDRFSIDRKNQIAAVHRKLAERGSSDRFGEYFVIPATESLERIKEVGFNTALVVANRIGTVNFPLARQRLKELRELQDPELLRILSTTQLSVPEIVEALKNVSKKVPVTK